MASDPEFLILKPGAYLPENEWRQLLGAAVRNHLSPLSDSVPRNPLAYNKEQLIQFPFTDTVLFQSTSSSNSGEFSLRGVGKLRWDKRTENSVNLTGKVIYIKRLKQHSKFWNEISKNEEFKQTVSQWLSKKTLTGQHKYQVCLVVGLLMMQDVVVATTDEEAEEREIRGEVPLGEIAEAVAASHGAPISTGGVGNLSAGGSKSKKTKTYFAAAGKGKQIFALELRMIKSKHGKIGLSDNGPKSQRKLGTEDQMVEPDSLVLEELDSAAWDALFSIGIED